LVPPASDWCHNPHWANDLKNAGFDVWWDRVSMPNRGVEFTREIEATVSACQRVLLVAGPAALNSSEYVTGVDRRPGGASGQPIR
jgi:hypothetical protein